MDYEVVIGLEVHVQLLTKSKMFCSCSASYQDADPNTIICEVCMGLPGVLPSINKRAVEFVIRTGLALDCTIAKQTKFDRKNYHYPDLMKGYQISQYNQPITSNGILAIESNGSTKNVHINRVHLEEDVAKLLHRDDPDGSSYSLLDINRSGVPLMEIVSEPDMRSPDEARSYLSRLRSILRYLEVSTANMEEGSFRCDANISVRPQGKSELGPKVEVKNMNSFRSVYNALVFEAQRQTMAIDKGERIPQETRGWVEERGVTISQRSKEYASDYRYFPEPDLPPMIIDRDWVKEIQKGLPELPGKREQRFESQYALPTYDASLLTAFKTTADFFEAAMDAGEANSENRQDLAKSLSNWILGELARLQKDARQSMTDLKIQPGQLVELLALIDNGTLSTSMAKTVFDEMFETGTAPAEIAQRTDQVQISDVSVLVKAVAEAITSNPDPVADYLKGKETAMKFLLGQVMRITEGKANPKMVGELIKAELKSMRQNE